MRTQRGGNSFWPLARYGVNANRSAIGIRTEIASIRGELHSEITGLRRELRSEITGIRGELRRLEWMLAGLLAIALAVASKYFLS